MKRVLILDPAESTGYCLVSIDETTKSADIFEYGIIEIDKTSDYRGDHYLDLMNKIQYILNSHDIQHIAIEDFFFNKKKATGSTENAAYRTAIHILARNNNIDYTVLSITEWKKYVAGRSIPNREEKKLWGKDANKIYIQHALWKRYGFRFPNHSVSKLTGNPIKFRFDIVDVIGQAIYFLAIYCNIMQVSLSVEYTDIVWKNKSHNTYQYE